jgi:HK97 family phage major capsid protein
MKLEEVVQKVKDALGEDFVKSIFNHPQMKEISEAHERLKNVKPENLIEHKVELAQSARFVRALTRGDYKTLKEIDEEERKNYFTYLYGIHGNDIDKKELTTYLNETTGSEGGHLVPLEYYQKMFEIKTSYGFVRDECLHVPMTTKKMQINKYITEPTTSWIQEKGKKTTTKPGFDMKNLEPEKQVCIIPFTEEVLADATPPLIQFLITVTAKAFKKGEDYALVNGVGDHVCGGTGVGILKDTNVKKVVMGEGKTSFNDVDFDELLRLVDAVEGDMDEGSKFAMNKNILHKLMMVKDKNDRYQWLPGMGKEGPQIWGYPYRKCSLFPGNAQDLPNTPFMIFGNLKECVAHGDRQSMAIKLLTEATIDGTNLAQYDLQALRFVSREDIQIILGGGISVLWTHE